MSSEQVWIVDDDSSIRWVLQKALQAADISCYSFHNPEDVLMQLESGQSPEVIISDIRMPQMDGTRPFVVTRVQDPENPMEFSEYLDRRKRQDPDIWILEIDIDDPQKLIALLPQ